jgi:hypothetical protein
MIEKPKVDINSPTWIAIREYHIARLDELRRKNDNPQSQDVTDRLRGQILEIKNLLSIEKPVGE